jgi:hypothetical protein
MLNSEKFLDRQSPISDKFFVISRDDGASAESLKPTQEETKQIERYALQPDYVVLGEGERQLFWRYRHSLSTKKEMLVKFLQSVEWRRPKESEAAITLMKQWCEIDLEQALPLLSAQFSLNETYTQLRLVNPLTPDVRKSFRQIRKYAV